MPTSRYGNLLLFVEPTGYKFEGPQGAWANAGRRLVSSHLSSCGGTMVDVLMPQLGEDISEGTVQQWLVQVGSLVTRDQPLLEVETSKATIEIPSPCSGRVIEIVAPVGATIPNEGLLARIDDSAV